MQEIVKLINFLAANKTILQTLAGLAALYAVVLYWAWIVYGPKDTTGNGITIGQPKAFDNRSLQLRIERLSASLANLKVVNQSVTENLSTLQKQSTIKSSRSATLEGKASPVKVGDGSEKPKEDKETKPESGSPDDATQSETKPAVALAASDVLSDQLNLASQILNLETLYERSLTDRLIGKETRLQTVLGFQVSITPPRGCKNSVAVVEVAVRMPGAHPISLVALIPQEKTYNAQTVSTSAHSIGGSAVASVLTLGFSSKGESRQLFIHRDSDTIAFERDARSQPTVFENDSRATVFGWEFRPVLGRSTVTAGTRQMLAVIAVPTEEFEREGEVTLEIQTRSYWRHFNRRTQTSGNKWGLLPWNVDRSMRIDSPVQELKIPNTARIQSALAPVVSDITWVNSGANRATVLVKGKNFFSGTKVVIGGVVHREEDGSLTLKSSQALEFETTIASLATGDCVLSGRFGSSFQFTRTIDKRVRALTMTRAVIEPRSFTKEVYMTIDVKGLDVEGEEVDLEVADIQKLPEPILFVGAEAIGMPYDYFDIESEIQTGDAEHDEQATNEKAIDPSPGITSETPTAEPAKPIAPVMKDLMTQGNAALNLVDGRTESGASESIKDEEIESAPGGRKYVRVGAWIPKELASSPSVAFRVPFCGFEYRTSLPLSYAEPTVTRIGGDDEYWVFRIASPVGFLKPFRVELDKVYEEDCPELQKTSLFDYRFKVPIGTAQKYQNLILRPGRGEPYLFPLSPDDKPKPETTIITTGKPPQIKKGSIGPVEWPGTALEAVTAVTLITGAALAGSKSASGEGPVRSAADFTTYDAGKKIEVYFTATSTAKVGKAFVEFLIAGGQTKLASLFITQDDAGS